MHHFGIIARCTVATIALAAAGAGIAQPVSSVPPPGAPQAGPSSQADSQNIVVTGSRIRHNPLDQDAPRAFIDDKDIKKTGLNSINDVLQRLPSSGGGINSGNNTSGNVGSPSDGGGVGAGSAEIDLRYLSSRRVLVLVDGLRFVNGAAASGVPGSTDLNSIPASAIDHVEVLQDGASAIYGSDAIAGVVNIITKRRQRGFEASAQVGSYLDYDDGWTQNYQLSWGNGGDGPTRVVIGANYVKTDGVFAGARALSRFPQPYSTTCLDGGCSSYPETGRFFLNGLINGDFTLNKPINGRPTYPTDFKAFTPADRFNFAPLNYLEIPVKRIGAFLNFQQELSPSANFTAKLIWNRRDSMNHAAPLPLGIGPDSANGNLLDTITISATNPFNPFGVDIVPGTAGPGQLGYSQIKRRLDEIGDRRYSQRVTTFYGVATLDGRIPVAGGDWFWDVNAVYGSNKAKQTFLGNVNAQKLQQALGPIAGCTAPCVPFNYFGTPGAVTQAMLDFVGFTEHDSSSQETWDFSANITGKLLALPGGDLGLAAGVEYRDLSGRYDPDPIVAAGFGSDIPSKPAAGGYNVKEAYAELNAPLLKDVPGAALLEFNGALRIFDYSTSGFGKTFKASANWMPIRDLRLRGSWAQGFRAPSIGELFGNLSRFDSQIDDPCSINSALAKRFNNDATVHANCLAQGVPASGSTTAPTDQLSVITGGNPALKPETSRSWIFGGVLSPRMMPGFSVEANWYNYKIMGAIQAVTATTTLYRCVYSNDPIACANVTRSSSGNVTAIRGLLQNIASIRTKGIDLNVAYLTRPASWGRLNFTWNNTFLHNFDVTSPAQTGTATEKRAGIEVGSGGQGYPKWKSTGAIDLEGKVFGATLTGRYISKLREVDNGTTMNSIFYTDAQLRWSPRFDVMGLHDIGLALGVNNLFNVKTPGCFTCDINNIDPAIYNTPGRYYYMRLGVKM